MGYGLQLDQSPRLRLLMVDMTLRLSPVTFWPFFFITGSLQAAGVIIAHGRTQNTSSRQL